MNSINKILLSAAGGAVTGAIAVGTVATMISKEKEAQVKKNAYNKGFQEGKASNAEQIIKMEKQIKDLSLKIINLEGYDAFKDYILAAYSVGLAIANCDGPMSPEEQKDVELIISGESVQALPPSTKKEIFALTQNPPCFNTAIKYVLDARLDYLDSYEEIMYEIAHANGTCSTQKYAFIQAWNKTLGRNMAAKVG